MLQESYTYLGCFKRYSNQVLAELEDAEQRGCTVVRSVLHPRRRGAKARVRVAKARAKVRQKARERKNERAKLH